MMYAFFAAAVAVQTAALDAPSLAPTNGKS